MVCVSTARKIDEEMCVMPKWPGLSQYDGGFSEYVLVPSYKLLVKVDRGNELNPEPLGSPHRCRTHTVSGHKKSASPSCTRQIHCSNWHRRIGIIRYSVCKNSGLWS